MINLYFLLSTGKLAHHLRLLQDSKEESSPRIGVEHWSASGFTESCYCVYICPRIWSSIQFILYFRLQLLYRHNASNSLYLLGSI